MSSSDEVVIDVKNVSKWFRVEGKGVKKGPSETAARAQDADVKRNQFQVLNDVSFQVRRGETVGIVGRNGAGKSTLLRIVSGMMKPDRGSVDIQGQPYSVMGMGIGFQRNLTGLENIHIKGAVMGASSSEIRKKVDWIVDFSELGDYIHQPMRTYSKGMQGRLAFAITFAFDPKILIVDEALSGGDGSIKRKAEARLNEINDSGATILLVSHGGAHHKRLCDRSILLDHGQVLSDGPPRQILSYYDRILNASPDELPKVIDRIKAADPLADAAGADGNAGDGDGSAAASFDPDLRSRSAHATEPKGGRIQQAGFFDMNTEEPVNRLEHGKRYRFRADVEYLKDCKDVELEVTIKTDDGSELFAVKLPSGGKGKRKFKSGDVFSYKFQLRNRLLPETYFVDLALRGKQGLRFDTLHRVSDIVAFASTGDVDEGVSGLIDLRK
ncbi:MAG: ABC transporter ATP-binding protein [Alphaproteobacteria bacterium]|nr:ABC transporter ATP-binding protein [Alphaproteobacteria bacterium]